MKGQWFLISAVIASSIFLTISFALKSFFSVDTSAAALYDEHYYFFDIKYNLKEYLALTKEKMADKGYFFYGDVTGSCPNYNVGLLLASEKFALCENVNSSAI